MIKHPLGRQMLLFTAIGIALDIVIAVILTRDAYDANSSALIVFLLIQGALIASAVRSGAILWAGYRLGGKKLVRNEFLDFLRDHDMPLPEGRESTSEYLARVADDDGQPVLTRLVAATKLGHMKGLDSLGFVRSLLNASAVDDALRLYRDEQFTRGGRLQAAE